MRLLRISLVALVALTITTGCSASRYKLGLQRDRDDRSSSQNDDHEYSPRAGEPSDDFREPSGEPVPAPPAMGISRVKSVSFLKDIGDKLHGRKDDCASDCVDDSELVGRCSPVEPCVPSPEQSERVHRFADRYYNDHNTDRLNPLRSFKKSVTRVFHHEPAKTCAPECSDIVTEPGCSAPPRICDQPRPASRSVKDSCGADTHHDTVPRPAKPKRSGKTLADPMEETDLPVDHGMISPKDQLNIEQIPALPAPGETETIQPESGPPAVPGIPQAQPAPQQPPVPVPQVEDLPMPPGTTQTIEPPAWPRLQSPNKQVSMPLGIGPRSINTAPIIIQPRSNR